MIYNRNWLKFPSLDQMPIHKVLVNEYECLRCGYKWINRVNGKEGQKPRRCGKCKRWDWDEGPISDEEKRLRRKLMGLESTKVKANNMTKRQELDWEYLLSNSEREEVVPPGRKQNKLCWFFLYRIKPRPSVKELEVVLAQPTQSHRQDLMKEIIELRKKRELGIVDINTRT